MICLQDLLTSRDQMSGQVNVEVDAAPQQDLTKILAEMREHYETVVAKSQRDLEGWFQQKVGSEPDSCSLGAQLKNVGNKIIKLVQIIVNERKAKHLY